MEFFDIFNKIIEVLQNIQYVIGLLIGLIFINKKNLYVDCPG